jgi:hypothetical protein
MKPWLWALGGAAIASAVLQLDINPRLPIGLAQANLSLYAPREWSTVRPGSLNVSVFAFSDRNRNGLYDTADKPLNRLAVRMTRPDASTKIARSNINGFTNYSMQRDARGDISEAGVDYEFRALPPPGWTVTTDNTVQTTRFREVPGSISGLGAEDPPAPVGLAPPLTLSGHWEASADTTLNLHSAEHGSRSVRIDAEGHFSEKLAAGAWSVTPPGAAERRVQLAYAPVVLGRAVAAAADARPPRERVLVDFDDLQRSSIEKIAHGYAGLGWDYLLAVDNQFYKGPGYVNVLMSGANVAYNSSGHPVTVTAAQPGGRFDFYGGYFAVAWHNAEGETLIARAFRDDQLVAEDRIELSHMTPQYFQADYHDISRLELETLHYWQFVCDNLEFGLR